MVMLLGPLLMLLASTARDAIAIRGALFFERQDASCLPWFLYVGSYTVKSVDRGDLIAFKTRSIPRYKDGLIFIKLVAGREGDVVDIKNGLVSINGQAMGNVLNGAQRLNKPLTSWDTHYVIGHNEFFMMGSEFRSFDSRYWGVIKYDQIIAKLSVVI